MSHDNYFGTAKRPSYVIQRGRYKRCANIHNNFVETSPADLVMQGDRLSQVTATTGSTVTAQTYRRGHTEK